jgi:glycosyltransferase involved in cell wall biosynthesis
MAFKNRESQLPAALRSALSQDYENFEVVLVDDYSTDSSVEVVRSFMGDPRVRLIRKENQPEGIAATKQLAAESARGRLLLMHDSDDTSLPDRLSTLVQKAYSMARPALIGSWYTETKSRSSLIRKVPEADRDIRCGFERCYNRSTFAPQTMLIPRHAFIAYPYRSKFKYMSDWDQILRIHESGAYEFANVQRSLYTYHLIKGTSVTLNSDRYVYNTYLWNCESRRRRGLSEYSEIGDFIKGVKDSMPERLFWRLFMTLKYFQFCWKSRGG